MLPRKPESQPGSVLFPESPDLALTVLEFQDLHSVATAGPGEQDAVGGCTWSGEVKWCAGHICALCMLLCSSPWFLPAAWLLIPGSWCHGLKPDAASPGSESCRVDREGLAVVRHTHWELLQGAFPDMDIPGLYFQNVSQ